jgi:membrane protein YdbS with pleckstrin-like domain
MWISPAFAHGSSANESVGAYGPLILLIVAAVVISLLVIEKKWRRRKQRLQSEADEVSRADST